MRTSGSSAPCISAGTASSTFCLCKARAGTLPAAPARADVELLHHATNHRVADSELLLDLGLGQVGLSLQYFCQLATQVISAHVVKVPDRR
jgi:hypothetical protein